MLSYWRRKIKTKQMKTEQMYQASTNAARTFLYQAKLLRGFHDNRPASLLPFCPLKGKNVQVILALRKEPLPTEADLHPETKISHSELCTEDGGRGREWGGRDWDLMKLEAQLQYLRHNQQEKNAQPDLRTIRGKVKPHPLASCAVLNHSTASQGNNTGPFRFRADRTT